MTGQHSASSATPRPSRSRFLVAAGRLEKIGRWVLGSANGPDGRPLRALELGDRHELEELYALERDFQAVSGRRGYLYHVDVREVRGQEREDVRCYLFADGTLLTDLEAAKRRLRELIHTEGELGGTGAVRG